MALHCPSSSHLGACNRNDAKLWRARRWGQWRWERPVQGQSCMMSGRCCRNAVRLECCMQRPLYYSLIAIKPELSYHTLLFFCFFLEQEKQGSHPVVGRHYQLRQKTRTVLSR